MNKPDQTRKIANETLEKAKAAVEQSARMAENIRDLNLKMIDMARVNTEAIFEFARQLATATVPSDIMELWASHGRKQYQMLSDQTKELTTLSRKIAHETAEPIARGVSDAFKKAA
jgi:hypothetical protein